MNSNNVVSKDEGKKVADVRTKSTPILPVLFNNDQHLQYVYKKTEKLLAAVYLVTNLFPADEPLKNQMRRIALSLMNNVSGFGKNNTLERDSVVSSIHAEIAEIFSLLEVSSVASLISQMNAEILKNEFANLSTLVGSRERMLNTAEQVSLNKETFAVENNYVATDAGGVKNTNVNETILDVHTDVGEVSGYGTNKAVMSEFVQKDIVSDVKRQTELSTVLEHKQKENSRVSEHESSDDRKRSRQDIIIALLKQKSGLTIKDFTTDIRGCSDKTIQRELLSLVAKGVLKKEGERRWSTYSLS
jgi:four helix bundle protein